MSLYNTVNERVGSLLSQGMGHVTNMVGLVRNYTTIPFSESFGTSGASWFTTGVVETLDASGALDASGISINASTYTPLWPWILRIVGWVIAVSIASFAANDAIMRPEAVRILLFVAVIFSYMFNPLIYLIISGYYGFKIMYNIVTGQKRKFPYTFAFLPLRTAKLDDSGWVTFFTSPFTYFKDGKATPTYNVLKTTIEPSERKSLEDAFPNFESWKSNEHMQKVIRNADDYFTNLNKLGFDLRPPPKKLEGAPSASASASASAPSAPAPAPSAPAPSAPAPAPSASAPTPIQPTGAFQNTTKQIEKAVEPAIKPRAASDYNSNKPPQGENTVLEGSYYARRFK